MRQDGNVVTVWQDTRLVTFISLGHNPDNTTSVCRKMGDGSIVHVECAECIVYYNRYMGGVDKGDQYRKYDQICMKSCKSYVFMFEVCVFNSFHSSLCNHPISSFLSIWATVIR